MKNWLRTPLVLWRSGYALALYLTVALYIPFLWDLYSYRRLRLSVPLALSLLPQAIANGQWTHALWLAVLFAFLLPCLLGMLLVGVPLGRLRTFTARTRGSGVIYLYLSLCLGLALLDLVSVQMQVVSGFRFPGGPDYDLSSKFRFVVDQSVFRYFGLIGALFSAALVRIVGMIFVGDWGWFEKWSRYLVTAELSDLDGDFAPDHGRKMLDFSIAPSPAIRYSRKRFEDYLRIYWKLNPGSPQSPSWLADTWVRVQRDLDYLLLADLDGERHQLQLLASWTAAWECVLERLPAPRYLVVLPYRNPSVEALVKQTDARFHLLDFGAGFYSDPWQQQKARVAARIADLLPKEGSSVVLLNEVCHFTGRALKLDELIEDIRNVAAGRALRFVVDGSDAVGNLRQPAGLKSADDYLFAGNHWLMAPQPCALVIHRRSGDAGERDNLESPLGAEGRAVTLAALAAALDLWKAIGSKEIWTRSQALTARFAERLDPVAAVVGVDSGLEPTNILAVKPRLGMQWTAVSACALTHQLQRTHIHADVVEPEPGKLWLKFAFPYFLEGTDVDRAQPRLRQLLREEQRTGSAVGAAAPR